MGPTLRENFEISMLVKREAPVHFPGRTNCKRAWNGLGIPLYDFSAHPQCFRAKCVALWDNRTALKDVSLLGPVDAVPFHGYSYRGATGKHRYEYIVQ